jgi:hypothetical protein
MHQQQLVSMKQTELDRLIRATLKKEAKSRGWQSIRGQPFWRNANLFFSLLVSTGVRERSLSYSLRVKWFSLDDQLWKILGMTSNAGGPMSLRAIGAYTITGQEVLTERLRECEWSPEWLAERMAAISSFASTKAAEVTTTIRSIDDYLAFIERDYAVLLARRPDTAYNIWLESLLIALEKNDHGIAREIATSRVVAKDVGGFIVGGRTFYQRALEYIS